MNLLNSESTSDEAMPNELVFNLVEVELARRWALGEVPELFARRSVDDLRKMVRMWWNIYHDSAAAAAYRDRTAFDRESALTAGALDTPALVASLNHIVSLFNLEAIQAFRPLHEWETHATYILGMITGFYMNLQKQTPP